MRNNDISNQKAPSILFRVEDFLVKPKKSKLSHKILDKLNLTRYELDSKVSAVINQTFIHTEFYVGLAVTEDMWDKYPQSVKDEIFHLPVGDVHIIKDEWDIRILLDSGEYIYYVDDNEEHVSKVGSNQCMSLEDFSILVNNHHLATKGRRN